jgi:hypothetical protein
VTKYVEEHEKVVDNFIDNIVDEASRMKDLYQNYAEKFYKFSLLTESEKKVW